MLTWAHIGDLHASDEDSWRSLELLARIVAELNTEVKQGVDFVYLPGDNANHGTVEQYRRIRECLDRLHVPIHVVPGDHDFEPGSLENFHAGLGVPQLPYAAMYGGRQCLFLDIVSAGTGGPDFRLGLTQAEWLERSLSKALPASSRPVVFMHAFPEDFAADAEAVGDLFAQRQVACVDTGHTHYNETLNDGTVIYTATRSTGQVEEGPPGFSLHAVDGSVVSWRFKDLDSPWPFVLITSPADRRLVTDSSETDQVPPSSFTVRAKIFGGDVARARLKVDGREAGAMRPVSTESGVWEGHLDALADGEHDVRLEAAGIGSDHTDADTIRVRVRSAPVHEPKPATRRFGMHEQSIGPWPEHGLMGTRLGPNKNGRKW